MGKTKCELHWRDTKLNPVATLTENGSPAGSLSRAALVIVVIHQIVSVDPKKLMFWHFLPRFVLANAMIQLDCLVHLQQA